MNEPIEGVECELERHIRRMFALRGQSDLTQWMLEAFTESALGFLKRHENVTVQDFADAAQTLGEAQTLNEGGTLPRPAFGMLAREALAIALGREGVDETTRGVAAWLRCGKNPPRNVPVDPYATEALEQARNSEKA